MPRLSELKKGSSIAILFYGGSGCGKTNFCGTAGSRALGINIGGGISTIQSEKFKLANNNPDPIIETITEEAVPDKAIAFDRVCDILDVYLSKQLNDFDTVWIDDITALRRFALNKGLEVNQKLGKSKSRAIGKEYDVVVSTVQDYGIEMSLMEQFVIEYISICRSANKHLIMTAHERINFNAPTAIGAEPTVSSIKPGFTGRTFPDAVTGHFDLVWHAEKLGGGEQIKYRARTVGDGSLTAHTKIGVFPTILEKPNFLEVVKKIQEGK